MKTASLALGLVALMGAGLALGSCAVADAVQSELFDTSKVNLMDTSYAAADMLTQQSRAFITEATPIQMTPLYDITVPQELTSFGQTVSAQIGARLVQLGYNVYTRGPALPTSKEMVMAPPAKQKADGAPQVTFHGPEPVADSGMGPGAVRLGGFYARGKDYIMINLQIVQMETGRILAAYDYSIPATRQLRWMTMTKDERAQSATGMVHSSASPVTTPPHATASAPILPTPQQTPIQLVPQ